jgi:hypothetical protein
MIAIVYKSSDGFQMMMGSRQHIDANYALQLDLNPHAKLRILDGTPLEGINSMIDPRIPSTVEEYDELYGTEAT